jgi:hypothetical protein
MVHRLLRGKFLRSACAFARQSLVFSLPATCVMTCAPTFMRAAGIVCFRT